MSMLIEDVCCDVMGVLLSLNCFVPFDMQRCTYPAYRSTILLVNFYLQLAGASACSGLFSL